MQPAALLQPLRVFLIGCARTQAYSRQARYYKLMQMAQKLLMVCITLFVSENIFGSTKLLLGTGAVVATSLLAGLRRPFANGMENFMDVVQQATNAVNALAAVTLNYQWLRDEITALALIGSNLVNVGTFVVCVIITPILLCRARGRYARRKRQAQQEMQLLQAKQLQLKKAQQESEVAEKEAEVSGDMVVAVKEAEAEAEAEAAAGSAATAASAAVHSRPAAARPGAAERSILMVDVVAGEEGVQGDEEVEDAEEQSEDSDEESEADVDVDNAHDELAGEEEEEDEADAYDAVSDVQELSP